MGGSTWADGPIAQSRLHQILHCLVMARHLRSSERQAASRWFVAQRLHGVSVRGLATRGQPPNTAKSNQLRPVANLRPITICDFE